MECCQSNPHDYAFCAVCGKQLEKVQCICGYSNQVSNIFCGNCGNKLQDTNEKSIHDSPAYIKTAKLDLRQLAEDNNMNFNGTLTSENEATVNQDDIKDLFSSFGSEEDD